MSWGYHDIILSDANWLIPLYVFINITELTKNCRGNLGKLLVLLETPWWVRLNEVDLEIFEPEVQKILNFW
jgi:hypothetical protein